jgi:hypothetical protein
MAILAPSAKGLSGKVLFEFLQRGDFFPRVGKMAGILVSLGVRRRLAGFLVRIAGLSVRRRKASAKRMANRTVRNLMAKSPRLSVS